MMLVVLYKAVYTRRLFSKLIDCYLLNIVDEVKETIHGDCFVCRISEPQQGSNFFLRNLLFYLRIFSYIFLLSTTLGIERPKGRTKSFA